MIEKHRIEIGCDIRGNVIETQMETITNSIWFYRSGFGNFSEHPSHDKYVWYALCEEVGSHKKRNGIQVRNLEEIDSTDSKRHRDHVEYLDNKIVFGFFSELFCAVVIGAPASDTLHKGNEKCRGEEPVRDGKVSFIKKENTCTDAERGHRCCSKKNNERSAPECPRKSASDSADDDASDIRERENTRETYEAENIAVISVGTLEEIARVEKRKNKCNSYANDFSRAEPRAAFRKIHDIGF